MKRNFTKRLRLALICLICFSLLSACAITWQKTAPPDEPDLSKASGSTETAGSYRYENMVNLQSNDIENTPPEYSGDAFDENTLADLNALMMPASAAPSTGVIIDVTQMSSFGVPVGGVRDDTQAFIDAINLASEYDTVYAPRLSDNNPSTDDAYIITDTLAINKNIHIDFAGALKYKGAKDRAVITTENLMRCNISIYYIADGGGTWNQNDYWGGYHGYQNDTYTGIIMTNSKWTNVDIGGVYNFTTGVVCRAATGHFWRNNIRITSIFACLTGLELRSDGANSYLNSNIFYDASIGIGRSEAGFTSNGDQYRSIAQTLVNGNDYGGNTNVFYNFRFENNAALTNGTTDTVIYLRRASGWAFVNYRMDFSGEGKTFCVLDFGNATGFSHKSYATHSITFSPLYVPVDTGDGMGSQVKIINAPFLMCPIDEIYRFTSDKQYLVGQDLNLRSKYLRLNNTSYTLRGYSFLKDTTTEKNVETLTTSYNSSNFGTDNEIYIGGYMELALTIEKPKLHSTVSIQPYGSATYVTISCYRADGSAFTTSADSNGVKLLAMDGYFSTSGYSFCRSNNNARFAFSVMSDEVDTVVIGLWGSISGYSIFSTDKDARILRYRTASELNNYDQFFAAAVPTSTEGLFGTIVYDKDDPTTCWQLAKVNNQLAWVAQ